MKNLNKTYLPISYDITDKTILILGGTREALKKIRILQRFTDRFFVVARHVCDCIRDAQIPFVEKEINSSDLDGYDILYSCTNNRSLDEQIVKWGHERNILVNIHDVPVLCDFVSPAIYKQDKISIAVSTSGEDALLAIALRDKLKEFLIKEQLLT